MALTIRVRDLGRRRPVLDDVDLPPPEDRAGGDDLRLRDVIEHVVGREVRRFNQRQVAMRLDRVLSEAAIARGAERGKVDPAGKPGSPKADEDEAVGTALQAFEDGLFLVIIDEVEYRDLDQRVVLSPDSHLVFLRLVFLAGA